MRRSRARTPCAAASTGARSPGCRRARARRRSRPRPGSAAAGSAEVGGHQQQHQDRERADHARDLRLGPACSATAVREPLVLTGNPGRSPPPRSRRRSRSSPGCRARVALAGPRTQRPSRSCRPSATSAMPRAPPIRSGTSDSETSGIVSGGNPPGNGPTTETPRSTRSNRSTAAIASTTAISTAGTFGRIRCSTMMISRLTTPIASAAPTV